MNELKNLDERIAGVAEILAAIEEGDFSKKVKIGKAKPDTFTPIEKSVNEIVTKIGKVVSESEKRTQETEARLRVIEKQQLRLRMFSMAVEQASDGLAIADMDGALKFVNLAWAKMHGYDVEELYGQSLDMFYTRAQLEKELEPFNKQLKKTGANQGEVGHKKKDGQTFPTWTTTVVLKDTEGKESGLLVTVQNITERKKREIELAEKLELINQQREAIEELSTPIIKIWDQVLVLPLIGTLDTKRSQRLTEALLTELATTQSKVAILDITGVPTVDSAVANHMLKTISAVQLLGAQSVITGIRPEVAQTVVHLGVDLSNVITLSNLAEGLKWALDHLELEIGKKRRA